ncbi:MAG TPA: glycosyltransferase family 2 protein [Burkholderiaceae bacterium]|nr:glycosyltransferase family 2 protein [Burkholderiaceae bacterium]
MTLEPTNETKPAPRVQIIVLNWNGGTDTVSCLTSIARLTYPNVWTCVVDNGSTDNSVASIRASHPDVEIIEVGSNLGFAGGNNVGIRRALDLGADYVLLLNNDTEVDNCLVDAFVAAAGRFPNAAAFTAKIFFWAQPRRLWYAGSRWSQTEGRFEHIGEGLEDNPGSGFSDPIEIPYACGCSLFIPAARLREIGLLDEEYFLYFEETDWCFRARAAGHPSIFVPDARVWHKVSVSLGGEGSPLQMYFVTRNRLLWARRHGSVAQQRAVRRATWKMLRKHFLIRPLTQLSAGPRAAYWALRESFSDPYSRAMLLGVRDYMLGRFGDCPPSVREWTQRARKQAAVRQANALEPSRRKAETQ